MMRRLLLLLLAAFATGNSSAQCPAGQTEVNIQIQPDNAGGDITWVLKNSLTQAILGSGGPYTDGNTSLIDVDVCVDDNTNISFVIYDSFGDGLCCLQGNGYYKVTLGGLTVKQNGTFSYSDSAQFYAPAAARDLAVTRIFIPPYITTDPLQVSGRVMNLQSVTATSMQLLCEINGTVFSSQTFSGLTILPYASQQFTFSTSWTPPAPGSYAVRVFVLTVNGGTDQNEFNDSLTVFTYAATHLAPRQVLLESFTSTSDTNGTLQEQILETHLANNAGSIIPVNYHLGIPPPGNDPMFLAGAPAQTERQSFYSVNAVPSVVMDGNTYIGIPSGLDQAEIDSSKNLPGLFDITLNETKSGNDVLINVSVTALVPFTGRVLRLYVAIVEELVQFATPPAPSPETDFSWVFRSFLPGNTGASLGWPEAGDSQSFTLNFTIDNSLHDSSRLRTIVFVQDAGDKAIYQAMLGESPTGSNHQTTLGLISENQGEESGISVYPQPAGSGFYVQLPATYSVMSLTIMDISGRTIQLPVKDNLQAGSICFFSADALPSGVYFIRLETARGPVIRKVIITH